MIERFAVVFLTFLWCSFAQEVSMSQLDEGIIPLGMDIDWVMQQKSFEFSGFFCEMMGFSSGLRAVFPQLRVTKSRARTAVVEPLVGNQDSSVEEGNAMTATFFSEKLMEKEKDDVKWLSDPTQVPESKLAVYVNVKSPTPKFAPPFVPFPNVSCLESTVVSEGVVFKGGDLMRTYVPEAHGSAEECCQACQRNALCTSWSYAPYDLGPFSPILGEAGNHQHICSLKGAAHTSVDRGRDGAMSGVMAHKTSPTPPPTPGGADVEVNTGVSGEGESQVAQAGARARFGAPKATIFHGTMCVKNNQTIYHSEQRRDANTIRVGRFMMERARFEGGMNIDEYSVMSCSSHMDEVWVPTEWHKHAFIETFNSVFGRGTVMNVAVAVIPEAVDTELFDPDKVRAPEQGNPFSVRSREPDDLCWLDADSRVVCPSISSSWQNRFEFLSVFKWEYRKGWDLLLEAYWRAFDKDDAVVLRLRTYVPLWEAEKNKDINYYVETFAQQTFGCSASELAPVEWEYGKNASLLSESLTRLDVRDLLGSADCFVLPTRGEGWGLPIAEAMAMRLPTIVSNSPGPRAYATAQNAYLIPAENDDNDATDSKGFFKPDKVALQNLLRQVVHDSGPYGQGRARVITAQARTDMAYLSPVRVAGMMAERLRMEADRRGWQF